MQFRLTFAITCYLQQMEQMEQTGLFLLQIIFHLISGFLDDGVVQAEGAWII